MPDELAVKAIFIKHLFINRVADIIMETKLYIYAVACITSLNSYQS